MSVLPTVEAASPRRAARRSAAANEHVVAIDGLRAVAVIGVIAYHLGVIPGGFLGVDLFFVISGFVITRLILGRLESPGRFRLRDFWTRRAKRLVPAVLCVLVAVQLWLHLVDPIGLETVVDGQTVSSLVYATNWYDILVDLPYGQAGPDASPLNHLWSLAIEEQFYLVWPVLLILLRTRRRIATAAVVGIAISVALTFTVGQGWSLTRLYQGTDIRMAALLVGALIAVARLDARMSGLDRRRAGLIRSAAPFVAILSAAGLGLLWLLVPLDRSLFDGPLLLATTLEGVLVASIVVAPRSWFSSVLSLGVFRYVGHRSYALYLWHWPVIICVSEVMTGWQGVDLAIPRTLLIVVLTLVSYAAIENPIRRSPYRGWRLWAGLALTTLLVAGLAVAPASATAAWFGRLTGPPTAAKPVDTDQAAYALSPVQPGTKLLVVGDSWAENLGRGMADPGFGVVVDNRGQGGCGIADPEAYMNDDGAVVPPPAQCLTWRSDWAKRIVVDRPDVVVLGVGDYDQRKARIAGSWVYPGDPVFDERYAAHLDEAIAIFTDAGIPVWVPSTVVLNGEPFHAHSIAMNDLLTAAVARNEGATLFDFGHYLCRPEEVHDCPRVRDGRPIYDATGHVAPFWQLRSAQWSLNQIQSAVPAPDPATTG
ncbi:acyltransferase family protein [Leifsonia aquatica]|uniref:acyltransferase family protein n=1 Tax=Leifsonia aquatica TaxID=144185 RepID=UPI00046A749D|nr:acyltransferase family protein [Leifsonia aquatica]